MANSTIPNLDPASTLTGTEEIPAAQGVNDVKITAAQIKTYTRTEQIATAEIADAAVTKDKVATNVFAGERYTTSTDLDTFEKGTIQVVTGSAANAPTANGSDSFLIISAKHINNGSIGQTAIQVGGTNAGDIYFRDYDAIGDSWTSWTSINT